MLVLAMESFFRDDAESKMKSCKSEDFTQPGSTDTTVQLVISLALGISAFFAFCVSLGQTFSTNN
jgi:hypothetical protein